MKIRTGFVSNSSSSSFVCNFCGRTESGMDMSLEEACMCECVEGHTFCEHELLSPNGETLEIDSYSDDRYCVPERFCPVCGRKKLMMEDERYNQYKLLFEYFKGVDPDGCKGAY